LSKYIFWPSLPLSSNFEAIGGQKASKNRKCF
jgi:hypothetical protein